MLSKSSIREYFIQKPSPSTIPQNLTEKLEKLSVFTNDKNQFSMKQFWDDLFKDVISMNLVNSVEICIEQKRELDGLDIIVAIQAWAKNAWKKGIEIVDINMIIISYILIDFLFLFPDDDLDWNFDEKTKEKLRKYINRIPKLLKVDVSLRSSEITSYSGQKYLTDYEIALEKNDHRGIFIFLTAIANEIGFHTHNYFIEVTSKLSIVVDINLLAENLGKFSPPLIRYCFEYLKPRQIVDVLIVYNSFEPLPLLIGIIQIVNPQGNNQFDKRLLDDDKLIEKASLIIKKITDLICTDNIYNYITNCSNIDMNELWHCIFSTFIAKNYKYHNHYLDAINFSHNLGEYSFKYFIRYSNDELDSFSCRIYDKYLSSLIGKHSNRLINFTSYFQYISQAIFTLSERSHQKYLNNLEDVSIELKKGIYSWKKEEWNMLFTKWMFWLLSSKDFIDRVSVDRSTLKTTYELIEDIRITDILEIDPTSLLNLLEAPGRTGEIALPVAGLYGNEKTIISWNIPIFYSDAPIK
jgi:hypothetical protein